MTSIVDSLLPLVAENMKDRIDYIVQFLYGMDKPSDLGGLQFATGMVWGSSFGQIYGEIISNLYLNNEKIRNKIQDDFSVLGVPKDSIDLFFREYVNEGAYMIGVVMKELPVEVRRKFSQNVEQYSLNTIKEYVGLEKIVE